MFYYALWVFDIVDLQQRFEPSYHKGRPIGATMPDRQKIEFMYMKKICTLNRGISDMSCHFKLIYEIVGLKLLIIENEGLSMKLDGYLEYVSSADVLYISVRFFSMEGSYI